MNFLMSSELCMVEMLTYFSSTILEKAGFEEEVAEKMMLIMFDSSNKKTVGDILKPFTEYSDKHGKTYLEVLKSKEEIIDTEYYISGKEWAQIIPQYKAPHEDDFDQIWISP